MYNAFTDVGRKFFDFHTSVSVGFDFPSARSEIINCNYQLIFGCSQIVSYAISMLYFIARYTPVDSVQKCKKYHPNHSFLMGLENIMINDPVILQHFELQLSE